VRTFYKNDAQSNFYRQKCPEDHLTLTQKTSDQFYSPKSMDVSMISKWPRENSH